MEATADVRSKSLSRRERVMGHVWDRCREAWNNGDDERAQRLHRMYEAFECMTEEDWIAAYEDCHPQDL